MQRLIQAAVITAALSLAPALAAQPIIYPAKGQSPEKQNKDDGECYTWAKKNSGVDPATMANAPPPPAGPQGERARGAARGAVGGAAIGAIAGDAGKGAGAGAVVGTMRGGHQARQREAAQNQQSAQQGQAMDSYYRAYSACMSGRGYTVN
jgi:hypothetical protein